MKPSITTALIAACSLASIRAPADYTSAVPAVAYTPTGAVASARVTTANEPTPGIGIAIDAHIEYRAASGALLATDERQVAWAERIIPCRFNGALSCTAVATDPYVGAKPPAGTATVTTWYTARLHARTGSTWTTIGKSSTPKRTATR